jgi:hypothetical protein
MSTVELQIAERAMKYKGEALHNLHHFIDVTMLQESYKKLNKHLCKSPETKQQGKLMALTMAGFAM